MSELPRISIVTCTLNSERYVEQAIQSVLSQNYPRLEYWVVDGGSTDGTPEIVRKYEGRVHWRSAPARGIADAMNTGIGLATGEIVAHLHSDDRYCPGALHRVGGLFLEHPEAQWIIGNYREIDQHQRPIKTIMLPSYNYALLRRWNFIGHQAVFVRRRLYDRIGAFDVNLRYAMDYDLWLRIGREHSPLQIPEVLAEMGIHPSGLTASHIFQSLTEEYAVRRRLHDRTHGDRCMDFLRYHWRRLRYCYRFIKYLKWMQADEAKVGHASY